MVPGFELPFFGERRVKIPKHLLMYDATNKWKSTQYRKFQEEGMNTPDIQADLKWFGLKEPGQKVRSITLGSGSVYNALLPLQGQLLSCWKNFRPSTMRDEDLTPRMKNSLRHRRLLPLSVSVDYKTATDLVKRLATLIALREIESPLISLALRSFGRGTIHYPELKKGQGDASAFTVPSNNGQPMGHVLSFPLLCAINYASLKLATVRYLKKYGFNPETKKLMDLILNTCVINGDDLNFRSPNFLFVEIFYGCAREYGLEPSPGKQFISTRYGTINSQDFLFEGDKVKRAYYYKTTWLETWLTPNQSTSYVNTMLDQLPWTGPLIPRMLKRATKGPSTAGPPNGYKPLPMMARHFPGFTPNWYLPTYLGGLGINPAYAPDDVKYTRSQRLVAAHFFTDPGASIAERVPSRAKGFPSILRVPKQSTRIALRCDESTCDGTCVDGYLINPYEEETTTKSLSDGSPNEEYLARVHDLYHEYWNVHDPQKMRHTCMKRRRWIKTMSKAQLSVVLHGKLVVAKCADIPSIDPPLILKEVEDSTYPGFVPNWHLPDSQKMEPLDGVTLEAHEETHELDQNGAYYAYMLNTSMLNLYGANPISYLPPSKTRNVAAVPSRPELTVCDLMAGKDWFKDW